jgi:hypothetical protein
MDIDDLAHALENAFTHAYPWREAADRNDVMRAARRLLEARARCAGARADRTAPATRLALHCWVLAVLLS